jgi:hypothetical protein
LDNEKNLKDISNAVRDYSMGIARWKRESYKGSTPAYLLEAIASLYNSTEKFFEKKGI